ncbi:MAG: AAC(3) family N-acetyltransferase [bacterium]
MYIKTDLQKDIEKLGINPEGTLLIHSSMKAVGEVEGRADTVLDAFMEYMQDGLLIFPTHSWDEDNLVDNVYNPLTEPSCVGILTNLFRKREGVLRSLHPTHSVAVIGKDAEEYIKGEEKSKTPCPREGCWGRLYDRKAQILFLGCSLKKNTYIHGVEEWNNVPDRVADKPREIKVINPYGEDYTIDFYGHHSSHGDVSKNYDKLENPFLYKGIAKTGKIGDTRSYLCDAIGMADLTTEFLKKNIDLFADDEPVPEEWYK